MNNLYEVLEICLNEIEQGRDVDTVLFRYPELADQLRPIIKASINAKKMVVPVPSQDIVRKNRAKLLQYAAEMREQSNAPSRHIWSVPLRRALVTLMVIALLFVSSTNLVRASSNTLPGDNLYPVKRTWEDVSLFFTFDTTKREELELEHENERLDELHDLFAEGRSANVDFAGYVSRQNGAEWRVSGITVIISSKTRLPNQLVEINSAIRVKGQAQNDMSVLAETVELLPSGSKLPEVKDNELENDGDEHESLNQQNMEDINAGPVSKATVIPTTPKATPIFDTRHETIEGTVTAVEDKYVVVKGIAMDIQQAEVNGNPNVGVIAKAEGYFDSNGIFIVRKIEFKNISLDDGSSTVNSNDDNSASFNDNNSNDDNDDNENNTNDH